MSSRRLVLKARRRIGALVVAAVAWLGVAPSLAHAQEAATITGQVTSETGAPLSSASVVIPSLGMAVVTGVDGRYSMSVPAARVQGQRVELVAALIGYSTVTAELQLRPGALTQDFVLPTDVLRLDEIVVTGAGLQTTRAKLGNTINSVRSEDLVRVANPNIVSAIAGKAPNVEISTQSGDPGSSSYIRIRGPKTIQGTGQPLFVVDGVPIDNTTLATGSFLASTAAPNRASDINPMDIESVEILKGAAAAAIYGSRAAQGVVLITTKKGQPGQTRFSLQSSYSLDQVNKKVPLQRKFGHGSGGVAESCGGPGCSLGTLSFGPELGAGTPTYDHFSEMFRTGHMLDNTLTVSGGNDRTTFYFSANRMDHDGVIVGPNNWYDRTSLRLNASHRVLDDLSVSGNIAYVETKGSFVQKGSNISGLMLGALRSPPDFNNKEYLTEDGLHRSYRTPQPTALAVSRGYDNPFYVVNHHLNEGNTGRVYGNVKLDYTPLPWLQLSYTLGTDYYADERIEAFPPSSSNWATGTLNRANFVNQQTDHNLLATVSRTLNEDISGSLTVGHNLNSRKFRQMLVSGFDYIAPSQHQLDNTITWDPDEFESVIHTESFFGQLSVDLFDQLYLTGALRNDGSSTFSESQRRHWYPKASAAWTFTNATGEIGGVVGYGKVRAAYGQTGREPNVYSMVTAFTGTNFLDGGWNPFVKPTLNGIGGLFTGTLKGQDKIKPERTKEWEVGLDLGLFDDRVLFGATYYDALSTDVIFSTPLPASTGYTQQVRNAATISNKGWELTLDVRPVTTVNFMWDLGFQWATNDNLVEDLQGAEFVSMPGAFADAPAAAVKGHKVGVLRGFDFARCRYGENNVVGGVDINSICSSTNAPNGALYIDEDGFPILDPVNRVIMDPHPDWTGSIRSTFTFFGNLQVSGLIDIKKGGQVWNGTRGALYNFGTHKDTEIRGQQRTFGQPGFHEGPVAGPGAGTAVTIDQDWFTGLGGGFGPVAAQFMEDGSYVKLREVALGYTLVNDFVRSLGLTSLDLRVAGRNLLTSTDYSGIDPETNLGGAEIAVRGIDYFNNPQTRSFVFTLGLTR